MESRSGMLLPLKPSKKRTRIRYDPESSVLQLVHKLKYTYISE